MKKRSTLVDGVRDVPVSVAWRTEVWTHRTGWKTVYQGCHEDYARKLFTEAEMRGATNDPDLRRETPRYVPHLIEVKLSELSGPSFKDERLLTHIFWKN